MTSTSAAKGLPGAAPRRTANRRVLAGLPWLAGASLFAIGQADAAQFEYQGIRGFIDTTLSTGVFFRMEEEDGDYQSIGERNFKNFGDIVTATTKATHDVGLDFGTFGLFGRVTYFYDPVYTFKDNVRELPPEVKAFDKKGFEYEDTADAAESGFDLLDYFLYTDYQITQDSAVHFRIGSQVISWGESLFFPLGINSINPVDAAKSRAPGAEVKEILMPIPLIWTGVDITPTWSIEGFYQLKWDAYQIDPVGSFFSATDLLGRGPGFIRLPGAPFGVPNGGDAFIPRNNADTPKDTGQWGINTHFTVPALAYTDFGLYYTHLASRIPLLAVDVATVPGDPSTAAFHEIYPEGLDQYGISFNTNIGNTAFQGEYSYRPDFPMIRNPSDFVGPAVFGVERQTYDRVPYHQAQASIIYVTPPGMIPTTDQMSVSTELVYGRVGSLGDTEKWYEDVTHSFLAWRAVLGPQWNNAFIMPGLGYMSLRGTVDFQMGIEGKSPPFGPIRENQQVTRLALAAVYLDRFEAGIEYSIFTGEDSRTLNKMRERDYAGITLKYSF